jgi:hypothetical protein
LTAETVQNYFQIMVFHRLQGVASQIMHNLFFLLFFLERGVKIDVAIAETHNMNQFMDGDVKQQRA